MKVYATGKMKENLATRNQLYTQRKTVDLEKSLISINEDANVLYDVGGYKVISQKFNSKGGSLILIGGTTAILENMIFTNSTLSGFGFGIQGGVFYIENSSPTFNKCQFIRARAGQGGTGWIQGGSPIFNDCLF